MAGYTTGFLESMAKRLREMPEVEQKERIHSKQESVKYLAKEIVALQKRGYTLDQITEALRGGGMDIATPTLKSYLQRAKPTAKPAAPKNTRKTAEFRAAQLPGPADDPAGMQVPSGTFTVKPDTAEI